MSDLVNRLRLGDTRLSRATLNEAADRIEATEAALREITIHNDNITKTIRAALAPEQDQ